MDIISGSTESIPLPVGDLNVEDIIENISEPLVGDNRSNARLKEYLKEVKYKAKYKNSYYKDEELEEMILKHHYFKNPCKYPIRIISIMKYLRKKGVDVSEGDIDLRVDNIVSDIPGVERVEFGCYKVYAV